MVFFVSFGGGGWIFVFVIFTKLIPRRKFFLYCANFGVDGTSGSQRRLRERGGGGGGVKTTSCNCIEFLIAYGQRRVDLATFRAVPAST